MLLSFSMISAETFYFEKRDWELDQPATKEITFVRLNNGTQIKVIGRAIVGSNAEGDLEEKIVEDIVEIKSVYPNAKNASVVIVSEQCGGNATYCAVSHYHLIVPQENYLRTYYIGAWARNISVVLDKKNKIVDVSATVYIGKDKYLTQQYKTCRFIDNIGFVDPQTNASCRPERNSDIYIIDF